jgi:hypothetical protein
MKHADEYAHFTRLAEFLSWNTVCWEEIWKKLNGESYRKVKSMYSTMFLPSTGGTKNI